MTALVKASCCASSVQAIRAVAFDEDIFDGSHATRQVQADLAFGQAGDGAAVQAEQMRMRADFCTIVTGRFDSLVTPHVVSQFQTTGSNRCSSVLPPFLSGRMGFIFAERSLSRFVFQRWRWRVCRSARDPREALGRGGWSGRS